MDGQPLEVRDPRTAVLDLEAHHARARTVDLDHEAAVRHRISLRPFDLDRDRVAVPSSPAAEEGFHVRVSHELEEEVEVVEAGPAKGDHVPLAHRTRT